jgi:KDO2-lipid IV(A) lauroyltransferase
MIKFYHKLSQIFSFLFCLLPWKVNSYLGYLLAILWVDVFRIRKEIVYSNIELAFPGTSNLVKKNWMRQSLFVLCRSFFDVIRIPGLNPLWIQKNINFLGTEHLEPFKNTGVIFLSLHMASGDLAGAAFSQNIKPLSLITKRFKNKFIDEFWFSLRTKSKTEFIDAHSNNNAFEILKALKRHRGVVFVIDQFMGKPYGVKSLFFGKTTGTAYGLALFAHKTKAPVLPLSTFWSEDGKLNVEVGPVVDFSDLITDNKESSYTAITNRCNQVVEDIIRKNPAQWMWVHRRWKEFE